MAVGLLSVSNGVEPAARAACCHQRIDRQAPEPWLTTGIKAPKEWSAVACRTASSSNPTSMAVSGSIEGLRPRMVNSREPSWNRRFWSEALQGFLLLCLGAAQGQARTCAARTHASAHGHPGSTEHACFGDRIKTVSKPDPFEQWDLLLSEEQTPHIVEKPENRTYPMEPKEASRGLHTQEVTGSSPVAPTTIEELKIIRNCLIFAGTWRVPGNGRASELHRTHGILHRPGETGRKYYQDAALGPFSEPQKAARNSFARAAGAAIDE